MVHEDVAHISTISRSSPYLLISLFLLTWNIFFTMIGVGTSEGKEVLYGLSLAFFPILGIAILVIKYLFLCTTQRSRHRCHKLAALFLHDLIFVVMGTLYLAGDNLSILICSGMSNTGDKADCMERSFIILGFSLLLHTALYIAGPFKLNPAISTLPVTGRIRKAYQSILQLAALTIFLDQTFTTVVKFITIVDIEMDESPACGCPGNTTNSASEREVAWFLTGLSSIILLMVIGLTVKAWKEYCSCCWIKRKSESGQCCCHIFENGLIFIMYIVVVAFMVIYTLADNRWLYKCTPVCNGDPKMVRLVLLGTSLALSLLWIVMYFVIIFVPGCSIVCQKKRVITENEYVSVQVVKENHKWVCRDARKRKVNDQGSGDQADGRNSTCLTNMIDKCISKEENCGYLSIDGNESPLITNMIGNSITIEENYGPVSITLPIEDDITLQQGWRFCFQGFCDVCCLRDNLRGECSRCFSCCCSGSCDTNSPPQDEDDKTCASSLEDTWQSCCVRFVQYLNGIEITTCASCLQDCWRCWRDCMHCCCKCCETRCGRLKNKLKEAEDEGKIMFTYFGMKENFTNATLSRDGILRISDSQMRKHPSDSEFYVILKPKIATSQDDAPDGYSRSRSAAACNLEDTEGLCTTTRSLEV